MLWDTHKESRGNAAVTFSPGAENQFYRFQKDRVLFLIPGANAGTTRPAEIELGYLANEAERVALYGQEAQNWDPKTVEGLQKYLNAARQKQNAPYKDNLDCRYFKMFMKIYGTS